MKTILGVMAYRAPGFSNEAGKVLPTAVDSSTYGVAVDRGALVYHDFMITIVPLRGEPTDPIVIKLVDVDSIEHGLIISPCKKFKKGRTVLRMHAKADNARALEHFCLKMSVDDHKMLHNEIQRSTGRHY